MDVEDAVYQQYPYRSKPLVVKRAFLGTKGLQCAEVSVCEEFWAEEPNLDIEFIISTYGNSITIYEEDELRTVYKILSEAIEAIDNYGKEDKVQEQAGTADS